MSLPQANARLTAIVGPGQAEDYDQPATPGTAKWAGGADGYVIETVQTALQAGELNKAKDTRLIVPADLTPPVDVQIGDRVLFSYAGLDHDRRVRDVDARLLSGMPYQTVTLHLDVAGPAG